MKLSIDLKILFLSIFALTVLASCSPDSEPVGVIQQPLEKSFKSGLSDITVGLFYSSKTADYPLEPISYADASVPQNLLKELSLSSETRVQEVAFETFFENLTRIEDGFDAGRKVKAERYKELQQHLEKNLTELTVYRVGEAKVGIYIVGKMPDGVWTGLRTYSIEQ